MKKKTKKINSLIISKNSSFDKTKNPNKIFKKKNIGIIFERLIPFSFFIAKLYLSCFFRCLFVSYENF